MKSARLWIPAALCFPIQGLVIAEHLKGPRVKRRGWHLQSKHLRGTDGDVKDCSLNRGGWLPIWPPWFGAYVIAHFASAKDQDWCFSIAAKNNPKVVEKDASLNVWISNHKSASHKTSWKRVVLQGARHTQSHCRLLANDSISFWTLATPLKSQRLARLASWLSHDGTTLVLSKARF